MWQRLHRMGPPSPLTVLEQEFSNLSKNLTYQVISCMLLIYVYIEY